MNNLKEYLLKNKKNKLIYNKSNTDFYFLDKNFFYNLPIKKRPLSIKIFKNKKDNIILIKNNCIYTNLNFKKHKIKNTDSPFGFYICNSLETIEFYASNKKIKIIEYNNNTYNIKNITLNFKNCFIEHNIISKKDSYSYNFYKMIFENCEYILNVKSKGYLINVFSQKYLLNSKNKIQINNLENNKNYHFIHTVNNKNSKTKLNIINKVKNSEHFYYINSFLNGDNIEIKQMLRNVLFENSKNIFIGNIKTKENISNCKINQKSQSITLFDSSEVFDLPQLNINTQEIEASHGSSSGIIDPIFINYLKSKGLNQKKAEDLYIESFLYEGDYNYE